MANGATVNFSYILDGDISGNYYSFNIYVASTSSTVFHFEVDLCQNGKTMVLASTLATASSNTFLQTKIDVTGPDPDTYAGDQIILKITRISGADGAILFNCGQSRIKVPVFPIVAPITVSPYVPDDSTVLLMHFDGELDDASGKTYGATGFGNYAFAVLTKMVADLNREHLSSGKKLALPS